MPFVVFAEKIGGMFIHLREQYEEITMEDGVFEVQDGIVVFDGKCIVTACDAVKKIDNTFKVSIISLYDEHGHQLKSTDIVEKGRVYTLRRKLKQISYKAPRQTREEILDSTSLAQAATEYPPFGYSIKIL